MGGSFLVHRLLPTHRRYRQLSGLHKSPQAAIRRPRIVSAYAAIIRNPSFSIFRAAFTSLSWISPQLGDRKSVV